MVAYCSLRVHLDAHIHTGRLFFLRNDLLSHILVDLVAYGADFSEVVSRHKDIGHVEVVAWCQRARLVPRQSPERLRRVKCVEIIDEDDFVVECLLDLVHEADLIISAR